MDMSDVKMSDEAALCPTACPATTGNFGLEFRLRERACRRLMEGSQHETSSPEWMMNVSDLVSDGDGSLSRSMTIKMSNVWQASLCFNLSSRHWRPVAR